MARRGTNEKDTMFDHAAYSGTGIHFVACDGDGGHADPIYRPKRQRAKRGCHAHRRRNGNAGCRLVCGERDHFAYRDDHNKR